MKMPPIVLKLKGEKMFSVTLYMLRQTLCRLAVPCAFHLSFLSFSDVAEAQSYFASTVLLFWTVKTEIYLTMNIPVTDGKVLLTPTLSEICADYFMNHWKKLKENENSKGRKERGIEQEERKNVCCVVNVITCVKQKHV
jgi:hypothetical protein